MGSQEEFDRARAAIMDRDDLLAIRNV